MYRIHDKLNPTLLHLFWLIYKNLPPTRNFAFKRWLFRIAGAKIEPDVKITSSVRVIFAGKLEIGEASWIGHEVLFTGGGESLIKLGKYCDIAPRVSFVAGTHEIDPDGKRVAGKPISESILIGGGVWVGSCATILGNTVLGDHCVVAAGAVVRGTFPQKCLIAGVPAKIIRRI